MKSTGLVCSKGENQSTACGSRYPDSYSHPDSPNAEYGYGRNQGIFPLLPPSGYASSVKTFVRQSENALIKEAPVTRNSQGVVKYSTFTMR